MKNSVLILLLTLIFVGCANKDPKPKETAEVNITTQPNDELSSFEDEMNATEVYDPLSSYNRFMTDVNDKIYINAMIPATKAYNKVVHVEIRKSIGNVFANLYFPMRLANNLLQAKFKNSLEESERFIINSTIGLLGIFDPATSYFEIKAHDEDFGQTLGFYGVGAGPHIVLPFFGPSNLRDTINIVPNAYISPIDYKEREWWTLTDTFGEFVLAKGVDEFNKYSLTNDRYELMKKDAVDLYPYLRDVYEQYRKKQIEE